MSKKENNLENMLRLYAFIIIILLTIFLCDIFIIIPKVQEKDKAMDWIANRICQEQQYEIQDNCSNICLVDVSYPVPSDCCGIMLGRKTIQCSDAKYYADNYGGTELFSNERNITTCNKVYKNFTTCFYNPTSGNITFQDIETQEEYDNRIKKYIEEDCRVCDQYPYYNCYCDWICANTTICSRQILKQQDFTLEELGIK